MGKIPSIFLTYATDVLGETTEGLSGSNIVKAFTGYAFDLNIDIPHGSYPFDAPNKRTALLENLRMFSSEQQYKIIRELCEHPKLPQPISSNINNLKIQLIARYASQFCVASSETLNLSLIEDVMHWLSDYPESKEIYDSALTKFNNNIFERNWPQTKGNGSIKIETAIQGVIVNSKNDQHPKTEGQQADNQSSYSQTLLVFFPI